MVTVHLIHGFNVSDGGAKSVLRLHPYLQRRGFFMQAHDYGWTGPISLRSTNKKTVQEILPKIKEGDVLIGHSNGALLCWELLQAGAPASAVICIQPAMRRDTIWPEDVSVLCLYNHRDWAVCFGRIWARFTTRIQPWRNRHGWGAAGRHGFTSGQPNVFNKNTCDRLTDYSACGHSTVFKNHIIPHWGSFIARWIEYEVSDDENPLRIL